MSEIDDVRMMSNILVTRINELEAENAKLQADCTHLANERNYWQNGYAEQQKFHTEREEELLLHISKLQTAVKWLVPGALNCGHECHWTDTYGFVPEAGCPEHDKILSGECNG